ncbi:S1 RNA-binding domain-containing protein, partial [Candidatus Parcubacteria bacterium]|nr:S1 RNA-binding domain-containing protein [Candidatus Parcubacteria bacterium]
KCVDNEDGFVELSLKGAKKELKLQEFEKMKERGEKIKVKILKVNRGGLLTKVGGFPAFLPLSQLINPPQNPESPLGELKNYLSKEIEVKILSILNSGELILSEKLAKEDEIPKEVKVGEILEGEVLGKTDFGIFVKAKNVEGFLSAEELPQDFSVKIGDKIKVKVKEIVHNQIFLSLA